MYYTKTSRTDNICNICGKKEVPFLSWDHVPPKGGIDLSAIEIRNYTDLSSISAKERDISQNGLKFRTICKTCNTKLGTRYDVAFNKLMLDISHRVTSCLILPSPFFKVKTYPTRIIKSVLGHILASKAADCQTNIDNISRNYLFNENAILPKDIRVYYWFYPYDCTIIRNDVLTMSSKTRQIAHYSVLKSFPLGFAVVSQAEFNDSFSNLTEQNTNDINKEVDIPINISCLFDWDLPERLKSDEIRLFSKDSTALFASKRQK
ncbi:MAG: hypothetical protein PHP79_11725 [Clostridia bacterium]|nr:hypothetical protein [Clostridia bacterium]